MERDKRRDKKTPSSGRQPAASHLLWRISRNFLMRPAYTSGLYGVMRIQPRHNGQSHKVRYVDTRTRRCYNYTSCSYINKPPHRVGNVQDPPFGPTLKNNITRTADSNASFSSKNRLHIQ